MDKLFAVIVELDADRIELTLSRINRNEVNIIAMLIEQGDQREIAIGDQIIPTFSLLSIEDFFVRKTDFVWLIDDSARSNRGGQMKNFLISNGIPEDFIVNLNATLNRPRLDDLKAIGDKNFSPSDIENKFVLIELEPHRLFSDDVMQEQLIEKILMPTDDSPIEDTTDLSPRALEHWRDTLDELTPTINAEVFNRNLDRLESHIKFCLERGIKPIGIVPPLAPIIHQKFSSELLSIFRQTLRQLESIYDFKAFDLFDVPLGYDCFRDMINLNRRGAQLITSLISFKLHNQNILPFDGLIEMNYDRFFGLSALLMVDTYHKLMSRAFDVTIAQIRRQSKIKVGFVMFDAAMWCGDDLYRLFERSERYEPTIILCLRRDLDDDSTQKNFADGLKIFASKNINAVDGDKFSERQDILIYLTPYTDILPQQWQLEEQTARTLTCYIPYGMHISGNAHVPLQRYPIMTLAWKVFLDTRDTLKFYRENCRLGLPRGFYSGYPRMDYFSSDHADDRFEWKEARPHSTKIVWAPHWSINDGIEYATFHLNCKFMYEYAKSHPKTSWVVKPHPNLVYSVVTSGLFRSTEEYDEYMRRWEKLPNARVVTGGYYQSAFASSDGMILDSGSFNAEYQYTHKPLLFLTRDTQRFTDIGAALMKVLYRADGRDHKAIASFIENVLIKKKDTMSGARKRFFDEHLNYMKDNGKSASEYIFDAIDREI